MFHCQQTSLHHARSLRVSEFEVQYVKFSFSHDVLTLFQWYLRIIKNTVVTKTKVHYNFKIDTLKLSLQQSQYLYQASKKRTNQQQTRGAYFVLQQKIVWAGVIHLFFVKSTHKKTAKKNNLMLSHFLIFLHSK